MTVQVTTAEKTVTLRYASGMDGYYLMVEGEMCIRDRFDASAEEIEVLRKMAAAEKITIRFKGK